MKTRVNPSAAIAVMKTRVCRSLSQFILPVKHFIIQHMDFRATLRASPSHAGGVRATPCRLESELFCHQGCQIVTLFFYILYFLLIFIIFSSYSSLVVYHYLHQPNFTEEDIFLAVASSFTLYIWLSLLYLKCYIITALTKSGSISIRRSIGID
jgi:hypothetical protein